MAAGPRLPRARTGLPPVDVALDILSSFIEEYLGNPYLVSTLIERVELVAGTNPIPHKLGRPLRDWRLSRLTGAGATVHETGSDDRTLTLFASVACTINLEVW